MILLDIGFCTSVDTVEDEFEKQNCIGLPVLRPPDASKALECRDTIWIANQMFSKKIRCGFRITGTYQSNRFCQQ